MMVRLTTFIVLIGMLTFSISIFANELFYKEVAIKYVTPKVAFYNVVINYKKAPEAFPSKGRCNVGYYATHLRIVDISTTKRSVTTPTLKEGNPISYQKKIPNKITCWFYNPNTQKRIDCTPLVYWIDIEKKKATYFPKKPSESQRCVIIPEYLLYMYQPKKNQALLTVKIINLK